MLPDPLIQIPNTPQHARRRRAIAAQLAAFDVMRGDGVFSTTINVEAGMFPREQVGEAAGADVFAVTVGLEETAADVL